MTEEKFWRLIERSRRDFDSERRDGNMERQLAILEEQLSELSSDEVRSFNSLLTQVFHRSYRWDLWGAAHVIGSGCGDDGFDYFRYWLISMGRKVYEDALADPESLATSSAQPDVEVVFFEEFSYVANIVLEKRGDETEYGETESWPARPAGRKWTTQELPTRFPKLWDVYGEQ